MVNKLAEVGVDPMNARSRTTTTRTAGASTAVKPAVTAAAQVGGENHPDGRGTDDA
jgi:hypothetical protein